MHFIYSDDEMHERNWNRKECCHLIKRKVYPSGKFIGIKVNIDCSLESFLFNSSNFKGEQFLETISCTWYFIYTTLSYILVNVFGLFRIPVVVKYTCGRTGLWVLVSHLSLGIFVRSVSETTLSCRSRSNLLY